MERTDGVGYLDLTGCMALGVTGPILRATGLPHDLRKSQPYCGYETYDFDVATETTCDAYGRFLIRMREMKESLKIVEQCLDRLQPGPVMVADKKIAWPAQLALGGDGLGNSLDHIREHHGHLDGGAHPPLQAGDRGLPGPRRAGLLGDRVARAASSACTSSATAAPARTACTSATRRSPTCRPPPAMCEGGLVADVIAAVASIDPVMGGVDR